jgi:hypothetical protein
MRDNPAVPSKQPIGAKLVRDEADTMSAYKAVGLRP